MSSQFGGIFFGINWQASEVSKTLSKVKFELLQFCMDIYVPK